MEQFRDFQKKYQCSFIRNYIDFSFFSIFIFWFGIFLSGNFFFGDNLLSTSFLIGSFLLFKFQDILELSSRDRMMIVFSAQVTFLALIAHYEALFSVLYMAGVPMLFGAYYYKHFINPSINGKQLFVFSFICLSWFGISFYHDGSILHSSVKQLWSFYSFAIWSGAMALIVLKNDSDYFNYIIHQYDDENINKSQKVVKSLESDRLFFHDIINQTHGISLFLQNKLDGNRDLSVFETKSLQREIKTIQTLVTDHFGMRHKNLTSVYDYVPFSFAKESVESLITSFLAAEHFKVKCIYNGDLAEEFQEEEPNNYVHFPSFYRVMTNIIKNISEAESKNVIFIFSCDETGLNITIKNQIFNEASPRRDIVEILDNKISSIDDSKSSGLGLESVARLIDGLGGDFSFGQKGEFWITKIFLPAPNSNLDKVA